MSSNDIREFALHPDREEVRNAIESLEVDPATDVIVLYESGIWEDHRGFPKGNLRRALICFPLSAKAIVVHRNGKEIFRMENIKDLFGSVYF